MDNKTVEITRYNIEDLKEGQHFSFLKEITREDMDNFSSLSGDINPLHTDDDFAKQRGFSGRVVYGGLLISFLSKLIGVNLPGENCLFQRITLNFLSPAYIGDTVEVFGIVDQVSTGTKSIVLKVEIRNKQKEEILARGKIHAGFTNKD